MAIVYVSVTAEDGTLIDRYQLEGDYSDLHSGAEQQRNLLSNALREVIEENFNVNDAM